jgi:hypothetical protein
MADFQLIQDPGSIIYKANTTYAADVWTKNAATSAWDAGFVGSKYIAALCDDQSVRVKFQSTGMNGIREFGFMTLNNMPNAMNLASPVSLGFRITTSGSPSNFYPIEDGVQVPTSPTNAVADDDEWRIQIVNDSGFKVKYWWRPSPVSPESLVMVSPKTEAQILALFPLGVKGVFFTNGGSFREPSIEITDTEMLSGFPTTFGDSQSKNAGFLADPELDGDRLTRTYGSAGPEFVTAEAIPPLVRGQDFPSGTAGMEE